MADPHSQQQSRMEVVDLTGDDVIDLTMDDAPDTQEAHTNDREEYIHPSRRRLHDEYAQGCNDAAEKATPEDYAQGYSDMADDAIQNEYAQGDNVVEEASSTPFDVATLIIPPVIARSRQEGMPISSQYISWMVFFDRLEHANPSQEFTPKLHEKMWKYAVEEAKWDLDLAYLKQQYKSEDWSYRAVMAHVDRAVLDVIKWFDPRHVTRGRIAARRRRRLQSNLQVVSRADALEQSSYAHAGPGGMWDEDLPNTNHELVLVDEKPRKRKSQCSDVGDQQRTKRPEFDHVNPKPINPPCLQSAANYYTDHINLPYRYGLSSSGLQGSQITRASSNLRQSVKDDNSRFQESEELHNTHQSIANEQANRDVLSVDSSSRSSRNRPSSQHPADPRQTSPHDVERRQYETTRHSPPRAVAPFQPIICYFWAQHQRGEHDQPCSQGLSCKFLHTFAENGRVAYPPPAPMIDNWKPGCTLENQTPFVTDSPITGADDDGELEYTPLLADTPSQSLTTTKPMQIDQDPDTPTPPPWVLKLEAAKLAKKAAKIARAAGQQQSKSGGSPSKNLGGENGEDELATLPGQRETFSGNNFPKTSPEGLMQQAKRTTFSGQKQFISGGYLSDVDMANSMARLPDANPSAPLSSNDVQAPAENQFFPAQRAPRWRPKKNLIPLTQTLIRQAASDGFDISKVKLYKMLLGPEERKGARICDQFCDPKAWVRKLDFHNPSIEFTIEQYYLAWAVAVEQKWHHIDCQFLRELKADRGLSDDEVQWEFEAQMAEAAGLIQSCNITTKNERLKALADKERSMGREFAARKFEDKMKKATEDPQFAMGSASDVSKVSTNPEESECRSKGRRRHEFRRVNADAFAAGQEVIDEAIARGDGFQTGANFINLEPAFHNKNREVLVKRKADDDDDDDDDDEMGGVAIDVGLPNSGGHDLGEQANFQSPPSSNNNAPSQARRRVSPRSRHFQSGAIGRPGSMRNQSMKTEATSRTRWDQQLASNRLLPESRDEHKRFYNMPEDMGGETESYDADAE